MSFNLIRNARVFFTTNVSAAGVVASTGTTTTNTYEIQVQDGFTFSQNTTSETVTLTEAGATPVRGQRMFNTALEPVDFSFSTYMRPRDSNVTATVAIDAEEGVLWNAMFSNTTTGAWTSSTTKATLVTTASDKHQLVKFGLIIILDGITFLIDDCVMDTATVDFGLDAIAAIAWTGKGATLRQVTNPTITGTTFSGTLGGSFTPKVTNAPYIANKLSTVTLDNTIGAGGTAYTVALTGGSLTISNNITYLTPNNLGTVNQPAVYFTGTRSITGTLNAYLRTGASLTGGLLSDMLAASSTSTSPAYDLKISVGGSASATRVDFTMPGISLNIPAINVEQVVSTAITFTAQATSGTGFDLTQSNELTIEYYAPNVG
jgi:hypothetical protein